MIASVSHWILSIFQATTTVAVSPSFISDRMWLNGKEVSLAGERYQNCLREIRSRAKDVVDEKNEIVIQKEDWQSLHLHIASHNNFPTAAGLASSAAGFACLVYGLAKLMDIEERYQGELSAIARQGSGSACRSLYGGFVKWTMGKETDGSDSVAVQLANEKHWEELVVLVAVVSSRQKETSSTTGMRESVETSELIHHRSQEVVPKRIVKMEEAIASHDFASFARITCADSNQFHAVCLDTSPPIFYMNDTSHRVINSLERWNQFEGTPQVAYTFDAGPNAVMFAPNRKVAGRLLQRLLYYFPPDSSKSLSSYVMGDTSILGEIDLKSIQDVESLTAPPELQKGKDTFPWIQELLVSEPRTTQHAVMPNFAAITKILKTKQGKKAHVTSYFFSGISGNQHVEVSWRKAAKLAEEMIQEDYELICILLGQATHKGDAHLFKEFVARTLTRNEEYKQTIEQLEEHVRTFIAYIQPFLELNTMPPPVEDISSISSFK
ncbi:hypothetical protein KI387_015074 [Taxus chinensis]|uniref:diphosphomevalonate decarboxylase n=1 Tax=Taxus chinensis TaxID=29808 RepID=A0AA38LFX0_TAXCH|nr:hypothetical protein KI387_015074 [Taxus chinensis]